MPPALPWRTRGNRQPGRYVWLSLRPRSPYPGLPHDPAGRGSGQDGDVIEVSAGTYGGSGNTGIQMRGKSLPCEVQQAGQDDHPVPDGVASSSSNQRGFYIMKAKDPCVSCRASRSSPDLPRGPMPCRARRRNGPFRVVRHRGGIFCENSGPTIVNCKILDCSASWAEALAAWGQARRLPLRYRGLHDQSTGLSRHASMGAGVALIRQSDVEMTQHHPGQHRRGQRPRRRILHP